MDFQLSPEQEQFRKVLQDFVGDHVKPHGHLYSVVGVPNHKVHAYYCPSLDTALFVNTDYYGQCKSWALGLAAVVLERKFNTHSIHGAAAEVDGKGIVIIAPTGTGKTTQVNRLMQHPKGKVIGDDWIYIHHPRGVGKDEQLYVYQPEVALYVRTENAENEPWLIPTFDRCKVENVVREEGKCESPSCQKGHCMFKQGYPYCYWGFGNSRALLPREWMMGPERVKDETRIDWSQELDEDNPEQLPEAMSDVPVTSYQLDPAAFEASVVQTLLQGRAVDVRLHEEKALVSLAGVEQAGQPGACQSP